MEAIVAENDSTRFPSISLLRFLKHQFDELSRKNASLRDRIAAPVIRTPRSQKAAVISSIDTMRIEEIHLDIRGTSGDKKPSHFDA
jgi:hypothetical protein